MGRIFSFKKKNKDSSTDKGSEVSLQGKSEKPTNLVKSGIFQSSQQGQIDKNLVTLLKPDSYEAEKFKSLRTSLLFPASDQLPPRSIMITSAVAEEGKTFVAANLAVSIAQTTDRYVLLMDCDMRSPSIHKIFGFGDVPGLSEYLSDDIQLTPLLLKTKVSGLTILPGGKPPPNPSELLSSEKMSELIRDVKEKYNDRFILLDSPPPLLMAGTAVIARQVDGIVIVVKYGSTRQDLVIEVIEAVEKEKVLGIVLNESTYSGHGKKGMYGKLYSKSLRKDK